MTEELYRTKVNLEELKERLKRWKTYKSWSDISVSDQGDFGVFKDYTLERITSEITKTNDRIKVLEQS